MSQRAVRAGFSLVEVVVALLLVSGAALAVTSTLLAAQRSQRTSERWLQAVQLAADGVEALRAGLALTPVAPQTGFERSGRVVTEATRPGVAEVEVTVRWDDDGARAYRLATTVVRP